MSVVLAVDVQLADRVMPTLPGGKFYDGDLADVAASQRQVEGPRRLVDFVRQRQATVAVIGVRLGGNSYSAMEAVEELLSAPGEGETRPAVVLVTRIMTPSLAVHAWTLGVFSIVQTQVRPRALGRTVADEALLSRAWRAGRVERRPFAAQWLPACSSEAHALGPAAPALLPHVLRLSALPARKRTA